MIIGNKNTSLAGKIICIDPGHGGKDPGCIGPAGTQEKVVNLQVCLKLKDILEKTGAKVVITRDKDLPAGDELGLQARCDIANTSKADIFVSIHHNANNKPEIKGTETYYYTYGSKESYNLAKITQNDVVEAIKTNSRGALPAGFYVLKYTNMPAILLEVGYLSNKEEEKFISLPATQDLAVEGIKKAITEYFKITPSQMEEIPAVKPGIIIPETPPGDGLDLRKPAAGVRII